MNAFDARGKAGLFDFGPAAERYEDWYASSLGKIQDLAQKADVVNFLECTEAGARLLDVGCGTGHWSRFFATLGYTVTGVDTSSEMIAEARDRSPATISFQQADAVSLPFHDAAFDIVAAMATLEFMTAPQQALAEMARCVRDRGRLLIGTLNLSAPLNKKRIVEGHEPYASGHLYTPEALQEILAPFGTLRMVASEPLHTPADIYDGVTPGISLAQRVTGPFIVAEVQR